jgi:cytochrome c-type biogenesis protein CcmH/NrfG
MAAMTTPTQLDARAEGRRRLHALRRRAHRIRVWVSCVAVVIFLAVFATIYVQLASGHDPALADTPVQTAVVDPTSSEDTAAGMSTGTSEAAVAPMTTRQS